MGDLNGNLLKDSDDAKFVRKLADSMSLQIIQHGATHHKDTAHTWLDVMFADSNDVVLDYNNLPATWKSHHNIIDFTLEVPSDKAVSQTFQYRDYKSINKEELTAYLAGCDWSSVDTDSFDVDAALEQLSVNLLGAINTLAPLKTFQPRKNKLPWIDTELSQLYRKRDATYKRFRRTGDSRFLDEFNSLRREADLKTSEARTNFYQNKIFESLTNNNVWAELRKLGLLPKKGEILNGFTPAELNAHFAAVSISPGDEGDCWRNIVDQASIEGFSFSRVTLSDVIIAISHFSSQARGEDGIPQSVVVKAIPSIGNFLVKLFNGSLQNGTFPALWKRAHVVPLNKCAAPSSPSDFRPIALLCFLSKVLEKLVHTQFSEHLERNGLLDPLQTGFRRSHSTQTALLKLTEDIRTGMTKRQLTLLLQFDFSKAFDTVSLTRLLVKLKSVGVSRGALRWFGSYLHGREQLVTTKSFGCSSWIGTNLGVPQGSVLGPLLFCIYINDVSRVLDSTSIKHLLYADDLQIYTQVARHNLEEGIAALETAAAAISAWATGSSLRLNTGKTKAIIIGNFKFINDIREADLPGVRMSDGVFVPFSDTVTALGVVLDSKMSWKPHIDAITKKFNRVLYSLRFFRQYTTETLRKRLVAALLFPHLDYCSVVYLDASQELRQRLQILQNSGVRYVFGIRRDVHISPYRSELGWLRTDTRRTYFILVQMYKILRIKQPSYLLSLFNNYAPQRPVRGDLKELIVPYESTEVGKNSFRVQGADVWNSIPSTIRTLPSLCKFKTSVKRHLLGLD